MNIVTVLHNKAMEFVDEALLARMEGNNDASMSLFDKAFSLEKEAATSIKEEDQSGDSWYILIRSAASLAVSCGKFQEAEALIEKGLSGTPPAFIVKELKELKASLAEAAEKKVSKVEIIGMLTYANAEESQIRLQDLKSKEIYHITVPSHLINEIVKSYWADIVQVKAQRAPTGSIILDKITKAA